MAQPNVTGQKPDNANANEQGYTQAQMDAAVAAAKAEGVTEGATAERTRYAAIMALDEAKERPLAAQTMIELGATAEMAKTQLGKLPVEVKAKQEPEKTDATNGGAGTPQKRNPFAEAMDTTDNPNLAANAGAGAGDDKAVVGTNELLSSYAIATGKERKQAAA